MYKCLCTCRIELLQYLTKPDKKQTAVNYLVESFNNMSMEQRQQDHIKADMHGQVDVSAVIHNVYVLHVMKSL